MPHILEAGDLNGNDLREPDAPPDKSDPGKRFAWENITRCLVIATVVALVATLSWRPAMLRFSQLMFLVSPSHGDSLAWKPEAEPVERPASRRHTLAPSEWRLTATSYGGWKPARHSNSQFDPDISERLLGHEWQRNSFNPWNWQDDAKFNKKRLEDSPSAPEQQGVTAFRVKDGEVWSHALDSASGRPPVPAANEGSSTTEVAAARPSPGISMPSLSPVPLEIPALQPLTETATPPEQPAPASQKTETAPDDEKPPLEEVKPGLLELPPLSFDDLNLPGLENETAPAPKEEPPETPVLSPAEPIPGIPLETPLAPAPASNPLRPVTVPEPVQEPETAAVTISNAREETAPGADTEGDWVNNEITGPISGAYLTIYPKLKFIGLCVPGHGYIRKYNQVAVPRDVTGPKFGADDGRTPYGKYYIAGRNRGPDGPSLSLSWPSPEDALRVGLPPAQLQEIEDAWLAQRLPPQNTVAGGGLVLSGDRDSVEETDGGFSLEEPHMEEIFTALPDGAWVFIQQ